MKLKRVLPLAVFVFLCAACLWAVQSGASMIRSCLNAVVDSAGAVLAGWMDIVPPSMPGVCVQEGPGAHVQTITFDQADLALLVDSISPGASGLELFANLLFGFGQAPRHSLFVALCYDYLSKKGYREGDWILNGTIKFQYPDPSLNLSDIISSIIIGAGPVVFANADVDLDVGGRASVQNARLQGEFSIGSPKAWQTEISYPEGFVFNEAKCKGGRLLFSVDKSVLGAI